MSKQYEAQKRWRERNPDKVKEERKRRWQRQKLKTDWLKKHNEDSRIRSIEKRKRYRLRLINILGNICNCKDKDCWCGSECDITNKIILMFDHPNGDGNKDKIKVLTNYVLHPDLAKEKLQLLCANCHLFKTKKFKENDWRKKQ